jgi:nitroreductase
MDPNRAFHPVVDGGRASPQQDPRAQRSDEGIVSTTLTLIGTRRNVSPKRLVDPGPSAEQREAIFSAAAAAPDHGLLTPWRFVIVPQAKRGLLAEVFALALIDRDPGATLVQIEAAREKAHRAPLLMVAVARLVSDREPEIPNVERIVSLGCAVQNLLLAAHAMGYGSGLTSGQAMASKRMRDLFGLSPDEHAVCFVNVGTVTKGKPGRVRPPTDLFVTSL